MECEKFVDLRTTDGKDVRHRGLVDDGWHALGETGLVRHSAVGRNGESDSGQPVTQPTDCLDGCGEVESDELHEVAIGECADRGTVGADDVGNRVAELVGELGDEVDGSASRYDDVVTGRVDGMDGSGVAFGQRAVVAEQRSVEIEGDQVRAVCHHQRP